MLNLGFHETIYNAKDAACDRLLSVVMAVAGSGQRIEVQTIRHIEPKEASVILLQLRRAQ